MSLRSERVDAEIATILQGSNAAKLQDLIEDAGLAPLVAAYARERFGTERLDTLNITQMRDLLGFITTFRALAKGAAG